MVTYNANKYATAHLIFKDKVIIAKNTDKRGPLTKINSTKYKQQPEPQNTLIIPGRCKVFRKVPTKLKGPFQCDKHDIYPGVVIGNSIWKTSKGQA